MIISTLEGVWLDIIGTKILRLLLHAIHSHLHQLIQLSPYGFLGLEISAESRWGAWVVVYIIFMFTFESNIVLYLITLYLCINLSLSHRNNY